MTDQPEDQPQPIPLQPPEFAIPEDERDYLYIGPHLTIWTRKETL